MITQNPQLHMNNFLWGKNEKRAEQLLLQQQPHWSSQERLGQSPFDPTTCALTLALKTQRSPRREGFKPQVEHHDF